MHTRPCLISTQRRRYSDASSAPRPSGSHTLPSGVPPKIGSLMPPTRSSTAMVGLGPMRVGRSTGAPEKDRGAAERDRIVCGARAQRGWRRVPLDLKGRSGRATARAAAGSLALRPRAGGRAELHSSPDSGSRGWAPPRRVLWRARVLRRRTRPRCRLRGAGVLCGWSVSLREGRAARCDSEMCGAHDCEPGAEIANLKKPKEETCQAGEWYSPPRVHIHGDREMGEQERRAGPSPSSAQGPSGL